MREGSKEEDAGDGETSLLELLNTGIEVTTPKPALCLSYSSKVELCLSCITFHNVLLPPLAHPTFFFF